MFAEGSSAERGEFMGDIDKVLLRLPFWGKLSEDEKRMVKSGAVLAKYEKGRLIHGGAEDCLGMIYIISGEIRTYIISEEGREITLFHLYAGDPCVFSAACAISQLTFETVISAQRDCEMLVINTGIFSRLTEQNIYVRCFMFELIANRFSTVMWAVQEILFKGFDRRLAAFLVGEYARTGSLEIRMTHEEIARRVSSAREVVARMLKRFDMDGLVETKRGAILIKDIGTLRQML